MHDMLYGGYVEQFGRLISCIKSVFRIYLVELYSQNVVVFAESSILYQVAN